MELALWLTEPEHPLTARVMVNRIWQWHFGQGLVRTPNNFGKLGTPPTHPQLLDYLARRFIRESWSIKKMHRLIMNSSTYGMSSGTTRDKNLRDPQNQLLSRFERRRLEVEEIRDGLLSMDGSLDLTMGGTPAERVRHRHREQQRSPEFETGDGPPEDGLSAPPARQPPDTPEPVRLRRRHHQHGQADAHQRRPSGPVHDEQRVRCRPGPGTWRPGWKRRTPIRPRRIDRAISLP